MPKLCRCFRPKYSRCSRYTPLICMGRHNPGIMNRHNRTNQEHNPISPVVTPSPCMDSVSQREGVGCGVWGESAMDSVSPRGCGCQLGGVGRGVHFASSRASQRVVTSRKHLADVRQSSRRAHISQVVAANPSSLLVKKSQE